MARAREQGEQLEQAEPVGGERRVRARAPVLKAALQRVVDVRRHEVGAVAWAWAYFFCLLSCNYVLRPVREEMGGSKGADKLPWLFTGTWVATVAVSPLFSVLVTRLPRRRFISIVYRFMGACLLAFFVLLRALPPEKLEAVRGAFFIWMSVFNLFALSVFWGFLADVFTSEQGKRLFGFIGVGGTVGAMTGSSIPPSLAGALGPIPLLLVAAALLEASVFAARRLDRLHPRSAALGPSPVRWAAGRTGLLDGIALLARSPYLLGIASATVLLTFSATCFYFEQIRVVSSWSPDPAERTRAYALIDLLVNVSALAIQGLLTGRILRAIGVGPAQALLPLVTFAGALGLGISPVLATLMTFQVIRKATDYAIAKPAREVLYTVVGADEKYKAKSFIDTFVYRGSDAASGWTYALLREQGATLAGILAPVAAAWIVVSLLLGRRQARLAKAPGPG
jgi:ATP:ADP antiporter, AAA family